MSTLAIPPERVRLYRALWDRWLIVLRILFDLGAGAHPVKWQSVANTLLIDKKTCQKYINGLVRDGQITAAGEGVMLTEAGMDALLENNGGGEILPSGGENFSLLKESVVVDSNLIKLTPPPSKLGKNLGEKFSQLSNLVFENIGELFKGKTLTLNGLTPWESDELLLGWLAYVWDNRMDLLSPVGVLYSKLRKDERPPMEYARNYGTYLPDEFLRAIGLLISPAETEVEAIADEPEGSPDVDAMGRHKLWLELIRDERINSIINVKASGMPVVGNEQVVFDGETMQVVIPKPDKRELMNTRLVKIASQVLSELVEHPAYVRFVVSVETEAD